MKRPAGYDEYINSAQWRNISALMKKRAGYRCQHCGQGSATLETHHIHYDNFGREKFADLEVLCAPCHEKADKKRVAEREARGLAARDDAAYETYLKKKHSTDEPHDYMSEESGDEFDRWLERARDRDEDSDRYGNRDDRDDDRW